MARAPPLAARQGVRFVLVTRDGNPSPDVRKETNGMNMEFVVIALMVVQIMIMVYKP